MTVDLYALLKNSREYGIKDQMLRASLSIPSNIAEGSERKSLPEFKRYVNIAKGSAAELRTQVYIAREVEILKNKDADRILNELKSISKMLQALHNSLNKRVDRSSSKTNKPITDNR